MRSGRSGTMCFACASQPWNWVARSPRLFLCLRVLSVAAWARPGLFVMLTPWVLAHAWI